MISWMIVTYVLKPFLGDPGWAAAGIAVWLSKIKTPDE